MKSPLLTVLATSVALAGGATADVFKLQVEPSGSSVELQTDLRAAFPGSLIGDFDDVTNPDGTQTRPGIFGGSGNQPIDVDFGLVTSGSSSTQPMGGWTLDVDESTLTATIDGFNIDLLAGSPAAIDLTLELLYDTFRSITPDSVYFGGITIPIPLGEGTLSQMALTENGPLIGTLVPTGVTGEYTVSFIGTTMLVFEAELFGQVIAPAPIPLPIAFVGTLSIDCSLVQMTADFSVEIDDTQDGPFDGVGFDNAPFELPTILPPGDFAGVLLTAELVQIVTQVGLDVSLEALAGEGVPPNPDLNGDGLVGIDDLLQVLAAWGDCPSCLEDFNCDDVVGIDDLLYLLANWS